VHGRPRLGRMQAALFGPAPILLVLRLR
jgi:hypothetical protein